MEKVKLTFYDAVYAEGYLWFVPREFDLLLRMDLESRSIECTGVFLPKEPEGRYINKRIIQFGEKLFFFPLNGGSNISYYDMKNEELKPFLSEKELEKLGIVELNVANIVTDDNDIWVIPSSLKQPLFKVDLTTGTVHAVFEWNRFIQKLLKNMNFRTTVSVNYQNSIWTPLCNTNILIEFQLMGEKIRLHRVGNENDKIFSIGSGEDGLYITFYDQSRIVYWNIDTDSVTEFYSDLGEGIPGEPMYYQVIELKNQVIILPQNSMDILHLNWATKKISRAYGFETSASRIERYSSGTIYYGYDIYQDDLFVYPLRGDKLIIYNIKEKKFFEIDICVSASQVIKYKLILDLKKKIVKERKNCPYTLALLMEALDNDRNNTWYRKDSLEGNENYGKSIVQSIEDAWRLMNDF